MALKPLTLNRNENGTWKLMEQCARLGYLLELDPRYAAATLERCAQMGLAPATEDHDGA
jgi:hypothetical protein